MRIEKIKAFSYAEAKNKAMEMGLNVIKNVTLTYKKEPSINVKEFANKIFERDKITNVEGIAYMIVEEAGTADTRVRPFEMKNNVLNGPLKKTRVFEIRTVNTDRFVGEAPSKIAAIKMAKSKMVDFKEDFVCKQVYKVDAEHATAFTLKYVPSTNTKLGTYIVFGN